MSPGNNDNKAILLYIIIAREVSRFPSPTSQFPFRCVLFPFPSHGWSYSHFRGNPMGPIGSRSFPSPCRFPRWRYFGISLLVLSACVVRPSVGVSGCHKNLVRRYQWLVNFTANTPRSSVRLWISETVWPWCWDGAWNAELCCRSSSSSSYYIFHR